MHSFEPFDYLCGSIVEQMKKRREATDKIGCEDSATHTHYHFDPLKPKLQLATAILDL